MIVVIVGPTGVGKTKMSIELAKYLDAPVINADAVQIYKGLDIGSAKVTSGEMDGVKHYLIDIKNIDEEYSVCEYQKDVRKILEEYKNKNVIICGGTGLYVSAALMDYRFYEDENSETYEDYSNEELYEMVLKKDKFSKIDKNNRVRMIRFLNKKITDTVEPKLLYPNTLFIGLTTSRDKLYARINERVDKMFNDGLVLEVKNLYNKDKNSKILNRAIGYKEVISYLNGEITLEEAKELIKKNSRHYAKRQYTWFNNKMDITWFLVDFANFDKTINEVKKYIDSCNNKQNMV